MAAKKKKSTKTTTAMTVARAPAAPRGGTTQIVVRAPTTPAKAPPKRKAPARRSGGGGGGRPGGFMGLPPDAVAAIAAGGAVGLLKKTGLLEKLPRLPYVGRIGSAAILAHLWHKQSGSALAKDVRNALGVLAAYQLSSKDGAYADRIEGDDGEAGDQPFPTT